MLLLFLAGGYTVSLFVYQAGVHGFPTILQIRVPPFDWQIHLVVALWMGLTLAMPEGPVGYAAQIAGIMTYSVFAIATLGPLGYGGELLAILAFALIYKYRLLDRRPLPWMAAIIVPWITARLWQGIYGRYPGWPTFVNTTIIVPIGMGIIWWLFEGELLMAQRHRDALRLQAERDEAFVEFGRNVSGIFHDLNADLGVLTSLRTLFAIEVGKPLREERIRTLDLAIARIESRVRRISSLTRASRVTVPSPVDVGALLEAVIYVFESQREFKRVVTFHLDVPDDPLVVTTVPSALLSIVENLVSNSCHALSGAWRERDVPPGAATIRIGAHRHVSGVALEITDNGPGLPASIRCPRGNCFNSPDFRIGVTSRLDGSGLGIPNARESAARIGAAVEMTSAPGVGVAARIVVPAMVAPAVTPSRPPLPIS